MCNKITQGGYIRGEKVELNKLCDIVKKGRENEAVLHLTSVLTIVSNYVCSTRLYRVALGVAHLLANLVRIDFDLGCSTTRLGQ